MRSWGSPSDDVGRRYAIGGTVEKIQQLNANDAVHGRRSVGVEREGCSTHPSCTLATAITFLGEYTARCAFMGWSGGGFHCSIGLLLVAGGIWLKHMSPDSKRRTARRFLPGLIIQQFDNTAPRGTSWKHLIILVGSDHLSAYSLHNR